MSEGFGVDRAESSFFDVVGLLREERSLKAYFLERVRTTLGKRNAGSLEPRAVPKELIELIAHELRWREIESLARRRVDLFFHGDPLLAVGDIACSISAAFKDDWEDREFYKRYGYNKLR